MKPTPADQLVTRAEAALQALKAEFDRANQPANWLTRTLRALRVLPRHNPTLFAARTRVAVRQYVHAVQARDALRS